MLLRHGVRSIAFAALLALAACQKPAEPAATEAAATAVGETAPAATPAATTEPASAPKSCGGFLGDDVCKADPTTYCKKEADPKQPGKQCVAGTEGVCVKKPDFCAQNKDPVCGCDGNPYGNACEATRAGVNVAYRGECKKPA